jgi:phage tail sheath protein FI
MATFYLSSGVYPEELDLSGTSQPISTSIGAIAMGSRQGTLTRSLYANPSSFIGQFGNPDPTWGYGHYSALAFLTNSQALWVQRVQNEALYAGAIVVNDSSANPTQTYIVPFPSARENNGSMVGRSGNFQSGFQDYHHIVFADKLVALNSTVVTVELTGPNVGGLGVDTLAVVVPAVVYATSSDNTLQLLAAQITGAVNTAVNTAVSNGATTLVPNGYANVIFVNDGSAGSSRVVYFFAPTGTQATISVAITAGTTNTTAVDDDNAWLFEVYYENPTSAGNLSGLSIVNADQGVAQQFSLTLSQAPVANQAFQASITINGVVQNIAPVGFATDAATTMNAIGAALVTAVGGGTFVLANGNLELIFTAPVAAANYVTFNGAPQFFNTSGSASLPIINAVNILNGKASTNTFELWKFTSPNILTPTEKYVVSFFSQVDGNGNNQLLEQVVNSSGGASTTMRVNHNVNGLNKLYGTAQLAAAPIVYMQGGDDGILPTNGMICTQGWSAFADRGQVSVRILINGGYTSTLVQQYMNQLAINRYDCFAILDMPSDSQQTADALNYRLYTLNIDSSYSAIYTSDFLITDPYTNLQLYVPPSGYVAGVFAYNDAVAAEWFAPAGLNRALLNNIQGVRVLYGKTDTDQLEPNQINTILQKNGTYYISSANTLQSNQSALSNINVRRLLITIEVTSVDALDYTLYEPNDPYTQFLVVQLGTNILQPIKVGRGLLDYLVVSNSDNNPTYLADEGQLNVDYILKPDLPVKFIRLRSVIGNQGAVFSEIVGLLNASAATTSGN